MIIAIFNLQSCTVYHAAETNMATVTGTEQIMSNLQVYKFFVHDDYNSYLLTDPVFNADGGISGNLILTDYQTPDSTWSRKDKRAYWKNHKYDINIYSNTVLSDLRAGIVNPATAGHSQTVTIGTDMIGKMTVTSINMEGELAGVALAMLIVLGVLVVLTLLITLIAVLAGESSEASSDGSDGSGSTSDSGSGGSGSGSSG